MHQKSMHSNFGTKQACCDFTRNVKHRVILRVLKFTWPAIHSAQLHANVVDKFDSFSAYMYTRIQYFLFHSSLFTYFVLDVCMRLILTLFHCCCCCCRCVWESLAVCERTYTRGHRNTQFFCFIFSLVSTDFLLFFAYHSVLTMKS